MVAVMQIQILLFLLLFFLGLSHSEHTVAEELGSHQLQRLVDLLTVHECEELFLALTSPEEKVFKQLERLSAEKNPLRPHPRTRRDIDKETHCHPALTDWLRIHGEQTYYDRLSLALQQIGRTDIAIEVGKNLNQDKTLELQRYVEEYHEQVNKMTSQFILPHTEEDHQEETPEVSARQDISVIQRHYDLMIASSIPRSCCFSISSRSLREYMRSLSWKDLDLVVERQLMPPYQRRFLDGAWPLLYGLIFGFFAALGVGLPVMLFTMRICLGPQTKTQLQ